MAIPLSVTLKLARAGEHIGLLKDEIRHYTESDTHSLVFDEHSEQARLIYRLDTPPPARLSVIIGDVVHNLRSALDHLANELVRVNGHAPHDKCAFPIYDWEAGFEKHAVPLLVGMDPKAIELLRTVQPYHERTAGRDFKLHSLWVLQYLSNADKHRQLNVITGSQFTEWVNLLERAQDTNILGPLACFPATVSAGVVVHDGEELAVFPMTRAEALTRQLDVEMVGATLVCLNEVPQWKQWGADTVLKHLRDFIGDTVLSVLAPFFNQPR